MSRKIKFAFTSIAILLVASILPVVVGEGGLQMKNSNNPYDSLEKNNKIIEVPVQIYTLHGVKEIKRELPVNEAKELFSLSNETGEAVKTLLSAHATFGEKLRANVIIDSFLYKMKGYGLLGNLTMHQARELITGKYLQKERNSIEMQKMAMVAKLLENNGWEVNAMCYFDASGYTFSAFLWNLPLIGASYLISLIKNTADYPLLHYLLVCMSLFLDIMYLSLGIIPRPTTIGYWDIMGVYGSAYVYTLGLLGEKEVLGRTKAITIGFTGIVFGFGAIGFSPFVAMKPY